MNVVSSNDAYFSKNLSQIMHSAFIVESPSTQTVEQENGTKFPWTLDGLVKKIQSMNKPLFAKINCLTHECP